MARIRAIKPEFFTNFKLYRAEVDSGYPLRIAFEGLWCQADREGRFKWVPEELKIGVMPYDDVDFSRVLDALWTRGYIEKYEVENEFFGFIPSFLEHQVINNRERESVLPEPNDTNTLTRAAHVDDATGTRKVRQHRGREGKGREGKGRAFTPPSEQEMIDYFVENGYSASLASRAFKGYAAADWKDSQGSKIKSWKQKSQHVWFREENKTAHAHDDPARGAI
jgi:hypothetical protein